MCIRDRDDDIAAAAIHLEDLEGLRRVHQRRHVANGTNVDLAVRQEGHGTVEVDGESAFHTIEDDAFDLLGSLVFFLEPGPALLAARFLARQHGLAGRILNALKICLLYTSDAADDLTRVD